MADKKETELNQEALDKLMEGASPGIQPWVEEEFSAGMPEKEKTAGKLNEAPTPILFYIANGLSSPHEINPWYDEIKAHTGTNYSNHETHKGYIVKNHPELKQPIEEFASIIQSGYLNNLEGDARLSKLAELEDQIMKKYNLPEKLDIFHKAEAQAANTQNNVADNDENKFPRLQPETYTKADIKKLMDEYNQYIVAAPKEEDKDKFNTEFEQTVIGGTVDMRDFASGLLSVEPDALDDMEKYIELFGKEYINGSYQLTADGKKAMERIKDLRRQTQEKAKQQQAQKANAEKSKAAKIKELMKKKPQDRTLQDYLFLKEAIEQNPRRTPEQKAKDIESLTSQARERMKAPKKVKDEELVVVPLFIDAFGYDKGHAINKDARAFRDAMTKRAPAVEKTQDGIVSEPAYNPGEAIQASDKKKAEPQKEDKKKKKGGIFGWFGKAKDWVKKHAAPIIVGIFAASSLLGMRGCGEEKKDNDRKNDDIENLIPVQLPEVVITPEKADINMLKQYAKRIGHQEKLSSEAAVERTMKDFEAFKKLPDEMKAKFSGQSDEEKLAKLGVVRGDQDKLHKPIDSLLKGEKINPLTLKDISERTSSVTDDFGAHKDNSLKNGTQSIQLSAYQIQKALNEKGITGK